MKKECYGINIDLNLDKNLSDFSINLLRNYYMEEEETSPHIKSLYIIPQIKNIYLYMAILSFRNR